MRILLYIGPDQVAGRALHTGLHQNRDKLAECGILVPRCFAPDRPPTLMMSMSAPDHPDPLRVDHGILRAEQQSECADRLRDDLLVEIDEAKPDRLVLPTASLGATLHRVSERSRLKTWLGALPGKTELIAHIDEPARALVRHYEDQVLAGRTAALDRDIALTKAFSWWQEAVAPAHAPDPSSRNFATIQAPPFWLDYAAFVRFWEDGFGAGAVTLRPAAAAVDPAGAEPEIAACLGTDITLQSGTAQPRAARPSAAWISRARQLNLLLAEITATGRRVVPPLLWRDLLGELQIDGPPIDAGALAAVSRRFHSDIETLQAAHPALTNAHVSPDPPLDGWSEADPRNGFRASQYLLSFMYRIDKTTRAARKADPPPEPARPTPALSDRARAILPKTAVEAFGRLNGSPLAPHNRMGAVDEEQLASAFPTMPARHLPEGSTGRVIVACMKNEAPYITEWIAHHRAIGIDTFLIYTNDCSDGTTEILDRLQALGIVQHVRNDDWKGKSPQQHALNRALKTPVVRQADWILHIDVDEFINVRTGNGTLDDFLAHVPDATHVAMTWRMFGHNGITDLSDRFVIDQFDRCAPRFCPKPHTAWGFKTMSRNIGAYGKLSCHRPNKLDANKKAAVRWVNGSGQDMTTEVIDNGWRNSRKSIGYDFLQLNHYALRSAESFLIKRQRGRALHVDRSIGLNYWIRMDWSDVRDITIKRNLPRLRREYDRLMADPVLRKWHDHGFAWHKAKAAELRATPEFDDLLQNALSIKLTETERVAYALALDMDS